MKFGFFVFDLVPLVFAFLVFFFENGTAGSRVGIDFFANEVLLGVNDAVGKDGGLFFADRNFRGGRDLVFGIDVGGRSGTNFFGLGFDCFVGRLDGFGGSASEKPAGQTATRTARGASGSGLAGNARLRLIGLGLRFEARLFDYGCSFNWRLAAVFRERFAGEQNSLFGRIGGTNRPRRFAAAIVKFTARAAIVATAVGITTAATIMSTVGTAIGAAITATVWSSFTALPFATLWRSIFGWRKIASALAEIASATTATSTATAETASATAKLGTVAARATVATTLRATIAGPVRSSFTATVTTWRVTGRRTILRRIVLRRKVLRRGFVGLRLALVFRQRFVNPGSAGLGFFDMGANVVRLGGVIDRFVEGFRVVRLGGAAK